MEFLFRLSPYCDPSLMEQVSGALEKRTELRARAQCPKLWRMTDYCNAGKGRKTLSPKQRIRYRVYSILLIVMGILLLVPGLMEPKERLLPLVAGIAGILTGLFTLWAIGGEQRQNERFDRAAEKLLKGFAAPPSAQVRFTREGMELAGKLAVSYPEIDFVAETKDLYLLTWQEKVTILQKKDLVAENKERFTSFLQEQITGYGTFCSVSHL